MKDFTGCRAAQEPDDEFEEWESCWDCGGEGTVGHDCGEDVCPCAEPENNMICQTCAGEGGWKAPE